MNYIKSSNVRKLVKEQGKRCGADFLDALDRLVYDKIISACGVFNGHHKTLSGGLLYLPDKRVEWYDRGKGKINET